MKKMGTYVAMLYIMSLIFFVSSSAAATPGVTQDKILVGNLNTLSGPAAVAGMAARDDQL